MIYEGEETSRDKGPGACTYLVSSWRHKHVSLVKVTFSISTSVFRNRYVADVGFQSEDNLCGISTTEWLFLQEKLVKSFRGDSRLASLEVFLET